MIRYRVPPTARRALATCVLVVCSAACAPRAALPPPAEPVVTAPDYEGLAEAARIPGLAIATIENGEIVEVELVGVANAETADPVTQDTLFEAASLSKPVFATAVLRLAERGEFDLDQPLHELLPYERISHDGRAELLTARLVLSHRTGLPNWGPEKLEFVAEPGEWFGYSGEGYVYLQRVLERQSGLTLDQLVRREVFDPLAMSHSLFSWPEGEELSLAVPHDEAGRPQQKGLPEEGNAAASLHTTAEDYARFVVAWMRGDALTLESVDAALEEASRFQPAEEEAEPSAAATRLAWGLGWGIQLPEEGSGAPALYWHWGDNGPFKAFVAFEPTSGDGLVYFANSMNGLAIAPVLANASLQNMDVTFDWMGYERLDSPGFAERLEGVVAEGDGRYAEAVAAFRAAAVADPDNEETARRVEWLTDLLNVQQRPVEVAAAALESYAGPYGPRTLSFEEGELYYQRGGGTRYRLVPLAEALFALDGLTIFRLEVARGADGAATKLIGHYVNGQTDESPRDVE